MVSLGTGSFTVSTPTYLTADPGAAGTTINVQSTATFPNAGRIIIDSELITYTGKNATQFNVGVTRGAGGTINVAHPTANAAVYPVTTVTVDPGGATITVSSTVGFIIPGVIGIENEYIHCTGTNAPTDTQFTNCTRGYKSTTPAVHAGGTNVLQYMLTTTGTVGNAQRMVREAIGRSGEIG
jgi:hypothetical protein